MNEANHSKFVTRKWNIVNDNANSNYDAENEITYNVEVLKFNLCDYNDAYILVRGDITAITTPATQVAFINCAPFIKCITKIDGTTIDDPEDVDLAMPIYNLIEYSSNYSGTIGSLWFYSKDEATNVNTNIANTDHFKSFKYEAKLLGNTEADYGNRILKNATTGVLLKYLSNFWRSLEMPLINCKVKLELKAIKYCVFSVASNGNDNSRDDKIIFL